MSVSSIDVRTSRFVNALEAATGASIQLTRSREYLYLHLLAVPREVRGRGVGTQVMRELVGFADEMGLAIRLTPASQDRTFGTTSRSRLVRFYKRFGFVENKGRHKDFTLGGGEMYRPPRALAARASGMGRVR